MSDRISADLPRDEYDPADFPRLLRHTGDAADVLNGWRSLLLTVSSRGWDAVRVQAGNVMKMIAQPKVLFMAAMALRSRGPKAPGPNGLPLDALSGEEIWRMCAALGHSLRTGTYRPGKEWVRWVEKASGNGKRPIVLMNVEDRVVQKAAAMVLRHWADQLGPCHHWEKCEAVCVKAIQTVRASGFEEAVPVIEMIERWEEGARRWEKIRKRVRRNPGYLVEGPLAFPTPTSGSVVDIARTDPVLRGGWRGGSCVEPMPFERHARTRHAGGAAWGRRWRRRCRRTPGAREVYPWRELRWIVGVRRGRGPGCDQLHRRRNALVRAHRRGHGRGARVRAGGLHHVTLSW